jgi:heme-degrading monooxygenase HmoA
MAQQVVLSFFTYTQNKFWAFTQMQRALPQIHKLSGVEFVKTLGTGAGAGFSLWPDFSTYALLTIWKSKEEATAFLKESSVMKAFISRSSFQKHFSLHPLQSHGLWGKTNPFEASQRPLKDNEQIGIITRATLRPSRLLEFWRAVPAASKAIQHAKGVLWYKGIGEWPMVQQATFSIWNSLDDVKAFAYKSSAHAAIVKKTRKRNWYKEDLFARFAVSPLLLNSNE